MTPAARRIACWLVILSCASAGALTIARLWSSHRAGIDASEIRWEYAALATALSLAFVLWYAVCWWSLLRALESRPVQFVPAVRLFLLAWPGRYVPGSIAYYGGRMVSAPSIGVSRSAVAASLAYENVFAIAASGIVSALMLAAGFRDDLHLGAWIIAALVAVPLAVAVLHPAVARAAIGVGARRSRRLGALEAHILHPGQMLRLGLWYGIGSLLAGLAYFAALRALNTHPPLPLAVAAYNLGGVAGMLSLFVPGGIGVREGVAASIVSVAVAAPVALSGAVLLRLISVAADLTPLALILCAHVAIRIARSLGVTPPVPAEPSRARS